MLFHLPHFYFFVFTIIISTHSKVPPNKAKDFSDVLLFQFYNLVRGGYQVSESFLGVTFHVGVANTPFVYTSSVLVCHRCIDALISSFSFDSYPHESLLSLLL